MYTLLCYFHQLSASILLIVARLLEKVISIVSVVSCLWSVVQLGAMCVQLLLQFKCTDRVETCHCLQIIQMRKWFIYTQLQKKPISHFSWQLRKSELRNENIVIPYSVAISSASFH